MDNMLFAGIDLHKTQFTVCVLKGNQTIEDNTKYETRAEGYNAFITRMNQISEHNPKQVRLAIESTSNSLYFKEMMEKHGFNVTVVNTLRFKVVNLSTKKTDKNDATDTFTGLYFEAGISSDAIIEGATLSLVYGDNSQPFRATPYASWVDFLNLEHHKGSVTASCTIPF